MVEGAPLLVAERRATHAEKRCAPPPAPAPHRPRPAAHPSGGGGGGGELEAMTARFPLFAPRGGVTMDGGFSQFSNG